MTADPAAAVSAELDRAVARANARFRPHGGGIELLSVTDGRARIRFAGLCTGCACRAQCLLATAEPELRTVDGVTEVEAVGVRLDPDQRERLTAFLGTPYGGAR